MTTLFEGNRGALTVSNVFQHSCKDNDLSEAGVAGQTLKFESNDIDQLPNPIVFHTLVLSTKLEPPSADHGTRSLIKT